jgi:Mg-chelatase subunit ChlD
MKTTLKRIHLLLIALFTIGLTAYGDPGVAVAIVYDTSGSMAEKVPAAGGAKQKYVIASETLARISTQIDAYAKSGNKVQAGIVCFPGANAVPFADWNPAMFRKWLTSFNQPTGGTPLGDAVLTASKLVADSPLAKKHVVVLTDGQNNSGISPDEGVRQGQEYSRKRSGAAISYYFVAFDTGAAQFNEVKKKGAAVLSAGNEAQLQKGLTNLFTQKILLEEEEK